MIFLYETLGRIVYVAVRIISPIARFFGAGRMKK